MGRRSLVSLLALAPVMLLTSGRAAAQDLSAFDRLADQRGDWPHRPAALAFAVRQAGRQVPLLRQGADRRTGASSRSSRRRRPTVRRTSSRRTSCRRPAAPARPSRSSTPTTTRTRRPTSRCTARSTASRRARRPTGASSRSPTMEARTSGVADPGRVRQRLAGRGFARPADGQRRVPRLPYPHRRGAERPEQLRSRPSTPRSSWAPSP